MIPNDDNWREAAIRRFAMAAVVLVAGLVVVIIAGSAFESVIGWAVVAAGVLILTSLVFLEVGYSEDRDRAQEPRGRLLRH